MLTTLLTITFLIHGADGEPLRRGELGMVVRAPDKATGAEIVRLTMGTPAYEADIRPRDIIESINGTFVARPESFNKLAAAIRAGETCTLRLRRGKDILERTLVASEFPHEVSSSDVHVNYDWVAAADGVDLRTVVSTPAGSPGPWPSVVLIGDLTSWPCDAFDYPLQAALAHELGRRGFAVVRWDARGSGDSYGGPFHAASLATTTADAAAVFRWTRERDRIDRTNVYVLGLGIGGVVAMRVAGEADGVAGLITWGTTSRPLLECVASATRRRAELAGYNAVQTNLALRDTLAFFVLMLGGQDLSAVAESRPELAAFIDADGGFQGRSAAFWRELDAVRHDRLLGRGEVPLLVLYGAFDYVACTADQHNAAALARAGRSVDNVRIHEVPGVDHRMSAAGSVSEAYALTTSGAFRFDAGAAAVIEGWIRELINRRAPGR